jgi:hypothetical protein
MHCVRAKIVYGATCSCNLNIEIVVRLVNCVWWWLHLIITTIKNRRIQTWNSGCVITIRWKFPVCDWARWAVGCSIHWQHKPRRSKSILNFLWVWGGWLSYCLRKSTLNGNRNGCTIMSIWIRKRRLNLQIDGFSCGGGVEVPGCIWLRTWANELSCAWPGCTTCLNDSICDWRAPCNVRSRKGESVPVWCWAANINRIGYI